MATLSSPRRWDQLVPKFFDEIEKPDPRTIEFCNSINPEKTVEDLFNCIWNLTETHQILTPSLYSTTAEKSACKASRQIMLGNAYSEQGNLELALKCYNDSVLLAPYPTTQQTGAGASPGSHSHTGNQQDIGAGSHSSLGWEENQYSVLAQAYCARADLLFKINQFELCQRDIDLALELGCPKTSLNHLSKLRSLCLTRKTTLKQEATKSLLGSFAFRHLPPPKLTLQNSSLPSLSNAVQLAFSPTAGRYLVAKRDIHPGELLGVEKSFITLLKTEHRTSYCAVCIKRCPAPLPCPNCILVVFCSVECQTEGMAGCHWQECPVLPNLCNVELTEDSIRTYKLMMKVGYEAVKTMVPQLKSEVRNQSPETLGFSSEGIYDGTHYRSVFHLVTNKDKVSRPNILKSCIEAFITTKLLQKTQRYFINRDGTSFTPSQEDLLMTGSTVLHHQLSLPCNSLPIVDVQDNVPKIEVIGCGLFPTLNLANHSCKPSCSVFPRRNTMVLRAVRFIPAGADITISYYHEYSFASLSSRKDYLMEHFYFLCTCEACNKKWPVMSDVDNPVLPPIHLKCVNCSQAIDPNTKECLKCGLLYDKRMPVACSLHLTTYNYSYMKDEIEKAVMKFSSATMNHTSRNNFTEGDVKAIISLIELICKYVVEPHPIFNKSRYGLELAMLTKC